MTHYTSKLYHTIYSYLRLKAHWGNWRQFKLEQKFRDYKLSPRSRWEMRSSG